jgi:hypothetical protein
MLYFYGEELLAPRTTSKLEDHALSTVRDCLFNIFAGTLNVEDFTSINRNVRTRRAVVKRDALYVERKYFETTFNTV